MKRIQDMKVGDMSVFYDKGFFEITKSESWIEQQGDRQVLVVECVFNGNKEEAQKHLESEFGYPVEIRQK